MKNIVRELDRMQSLHTNDNVSGYIEDFIIRDVYLQYNELLPHPLYIANHLPLDKYNFEAAYEVAETL